MEQLTIYFNISHWHQWTELAGLYPEFLFGSFNIFSVLKHLTALSGRTFLTTYKIQVLQRKYFALFDLRKSECNG